MGAINRLGYTKLGEDKDKAPILVQTASRNLRSGARAYAARPATGAQEKPVLPRADV
jgi:hypothetical protein